MCTTFEHGYDAGCGGCSGEESGVDACNVLALWKEIVQDCKLDYPTTQLNFIEK